MLDPKKSPKNKEIENSNEDDPISTAIGEYGRWQLLITFLLSLFNIPCTWHIFVPTFSAAARDFWCAPPPHLATLDPQVWREFSQPEGPCTILDLDWTNVNFSMVKDGKAPYGNLTECLSWVWEGEGTIYFSSNYNSLQLPIICIFIVGDTLVSEWELVCKNEQLNNVAEMVFLAGVAIGGLVGGLVSDRYGRKRTLMVSVLLQTIIGITTLLIYFTKYY